MDAKGDQLVYEAEQILRKTGGLFGLFGSSSEKYEDAAERLNRAGNAYKACKRWADAANAYRRAAECFVKAKSESECASAYVESARCFIKAGDARSGTEILQNEALPRIVDTGRLTQAAKLHQEVAEMFEGEGDLENAIHHFQQAADFWSAENSPSSAQKCLARIAHNAAQLEPPDFRRSAEVFEQVGRDCMSSNLLKFSAKMYFFNAVLCTLARGDAVAAGMQLDTVKDLDYTFAGSSECRLLEDVLQAYRDINVEAFTDAVYNFDKISKLDPWRTNILLRVKTAIQKGGGLDGEGGVDLT